MEKEKSREKDFSVSIAVELIADAHLWRAHNRLRRNKSDCAGVKVPPEGYECNANVMHLALHVKRAVLDHQIEASIASLPSVGFALMKKEQTLNFRVSAEFKRKLLEEAQKERRSLTNYLETTLTKLWAEQELTSRKKRSPKADR